MILEPTEAPDPRLPGMKPLASLPPALNVCIQKVRNNIRRLADDPKACAWAADGNYFNSTDGFYHINNWTTSFFTGMALLAWRLTGEFYFLKQLNRLAPHYRLKVFEHQADTMHDLGFLYSLYSVAIYKLTGDMAHREVALRAADVLAARFDARGKYIRAWGRMDVPDGEFAGLAIIDSMMNLPLLFWAAAESGKSRYRDIAIQHADTTLRHFVRADGSVFHAYRFDVKTGRPVGPDNYCGWTVGSHWARGTAWAIYGFALAFRYANEPRFLQTSLKLARKFFAALKGESLPAWDFYLPPEAQVLRDSSAAAIAVCGVQELLHHHLGDSALKEAAQSLLSVLCSAQCLDVDVSCPGVLRQAQVSDAPGRAKNVYAIWGDYFFMEALTKAHVPLEMFW